MASSTKFIGAATSVQIDASDEAWSNLANLTADDDTFAEATSSTTDPFTEAIKATMSGNEFAIPSGASIDGIEVEYSAKADSGGSEVWDERHVQLQVGGDRTGLDYGDTGNDISPTEAAFTKGGSTDKWGIPLTVSAVNASDFGVWLRFKRQGGSTKTIQVDYIKITVYYTVGGGDISYDSTGAVAVGRLTGLNNEGDTTKFRMKFPGFGTPKAAIIIANNVIHDADSQYDAQTQPFTNAADVSYNVAVTDGTNVNTTQNTQRGTTVDRGMYSSTIVADAQGQVDFQAFGTDYVEFNTVSSDEDKVQFTVIVFGGSSVQSHQGFQPGLDGSTNATSDITAPGFEPNIVIFVSGLEGQTQNHSVYGGVGIGFVYNPGTGDANVVQKHYLIEQRYKDNSIDDNTLTDIQNMMRVSTDRCHSHINYGRDPQQEYYWTVGSFDANGFTVTSNGEDSTDPEQDDGSAYLALDFPHDIAVGIFDTPTTTGAKSFGDADFAPDIGFTPASLISVWGKADAVDLLAEDSAEGDTCSIFAATDHTNGSVGYSNQNGAATTNPFNYISDGIYVADGDQTALLDASFDGFTDGGFDATFATVDGTARKGIFLALGTAAAGGGGTTGTAAQTLPAVTQSATGIMTFTATADQTFASLTQSASGSTLEGNTGTIAQSLPTITQSADGSLQFSGTTSQMLAAITQSASGGLTFTGTAAQTLASVVQSASGEIGRVGTITQTLPVITQDGTGEFSFSSTSSQILPAITQSARESEQEEVVGPPGSMFTSKGIRVSFKKSRFRK